MCGTRARVCTDNIIRERQKTNIAVRDVSYAMCRFTSVREREKDRRREIVGGRKIDRERERDISVRQDERGSKNTVRYMI